MITSAMIGEKDASKPGQGEHSARQGGTKLTPCGPYGDVIPQLKSYDLLAQSANRTAHYGGLARARGGGFFLEDGDSSWSHVP
jgi:hypothetical protein